MSSINQKRVLIFTGHYGSGKTETAINYAIQHRNAFPETTLVDLDFVNPYFRSREAKELLGSHGIDVVASTEEYFNTDLPAFSRRIGGELTKDNTLVIVDLGGDENGARAIGRFRNLLTENDYELLFVINPFRPFTSKPAEIKTVIDQVEKASGLKVSALVSNPNLITETTVQVIFSGHRVVLDTADWLGMPVKFAAIEDRFCGMPEIENLGIPVLSIERKMLVPWE